MAKAQEVKKLLLVQASIVEQDIKLQTALTLQPPPPECKCVKERVFQGITLSALTA